MKKSRLVSIVLIVIMSLSVILFTKDVFAAENILLDITSSGNNTTNSTTNTATNNTTNTTNTTTNTTNTTNKTNNVLTTGNTSSYNNTTNSLPSTGIEDSVPGVVLVVVLGISAAYAYNKIKYYKDI